MSIWSQRDRVLGTSNLKRVYQAAISESRCDPRISTAHKRQRSSTLQRISFIFAQIHTRLSRIAEPITRLLRKDTAFIWGEEQATAFEAIKASLISEPVLKIFDPNNKSILQLHTDASAVGSGAILFQDGHPIGYYSRKFTDAESRYNTSEQEFLAVKLAIEYFDIYLEGTPFILVTDHEALKWVVNSKSKNRKLYSWAIELHLRC